MLLGHRSACILTDTSREPLHPEGRRYITADARTRESLTRVVDKLRTLENWIGVIDGGGNRTEMDRKLYALSDIVLLPFRESHEDIRTVIRDLEMFALLASSTALSLRRRALFSASARAAVRFFCSSL